MIDISGDTTTAAWRLEDAGDGIVFLVLDVPGEKVNVLSEAVLQDLDAVLDALERDRDLRALIVMGGKEDSGTFIAGADVHEIRDVEDEEEASTKAAFGQAILGRFRSLGAVTIAAIDGHCLGGGTELALACDLRVATSSRETSLGLPDVQLGMLPRLGGTQRLPRLVGLGRALPIILGGTPQSVEKAARVGLVDRAVDPGRLREEAVALAAEALESGGKEYRPRRPRRPWLVGLLEATPPGRAWIRWQARRRVLRRVGPHYPAPMRAVDAAVGGYGRSLEAGLQLEAKLAGELAASPISRNLIDLFVTSEEARRGPADPGAEARRARARVSEGARVGLLGAGVMGSGLVALLSRKGFRVRMKDLSWERVGGGIRSVDRAFAEREERGRMTRAERDDCMAAISTTIDDGGFGSVGFVIETVTESLEVKREAIGAIEARVPADAVLASNTSSLSIARIAEALGRPERFVGLHFFHPVDRMLPVEVVRGERTGEEAIEAAEALARKLGRIPVRVADGPGFLVNRVLAPYFNEAVRLFGEGYSPLAIDAVIRRFGMPLGPFELLDHVGLDVAADVGRALHEAFGERAEPPPLMSEIREKSDLLGKRSGKGFYLHGAKRRRPNAEVLRMGCARGSDLKADDPDLWVKRLIYPLINEAARALEEKIVEKPSLVDLAMVLGMGFAPFRGGPLRFADALGARQVTEALKNLREPRLAPCEFLERLAAEGRGFYSPEAKEEGPEEAEGALHSAERVAVG